VDRCQTAEASEPILERNAASGLSRHAAIQTMIARTALVGSTPVSL
jgi:hypothetical protein